MAAPEITIEVPEKKWYNAIILLKDIKSKAAPFTLALAPLAYSVRMAYSAFAYRADERAELSHKQKRPQCRPNFQIRPRRGHHNSEFRIKTRTEVNLS